MAALSHAARRRIAEHRARRGAHNRAGSEVASAQPTVRAGRPAAATAETASGLSGEPAALRRLARRGCRRGRLLRLRRSTGMCWWPRQSRASGHRLLKPISPAPDPPTMLQCPSLLLPPQSPPHRCREGGPLLWAPSGLPTPSFLADL